MLEITEAREAGKTKSQINLMTVFQFQVHQRKEANMGYLTVTRREGEQIRLTIDPGVDTEKLLQHLLRDGITISLGGIDKNKVTVAIEAPKQILILRDELIG